MCPQSAVVEPGTQGRRVTWELGFAHGRQNICEKKEVSGVPMDSLGKGVFREPLSKAIYSTAESFLLSAGTWYSIWQFLGHLWFEIKHHYHNSICSMQSVDIFFFYSSFFYIYLTAPKSTQNPYHSWVTGLSGGFRLPMAVTDDGNVLRRVITLVICLPFINWATPWKNSSIT